MYHAPEHALAIVLRFTLEHASRLNLVHGLTKAHALVLGLSVLIPPALETSFALTYGFETALMPTVLDIKSFTSLIRNSIQLGITDSYTAPFKPANFLALGRVSKISRVLRVALTIPTV